MVHPYEFDYKNNPSDIETTLRQVKKYGISIARGFVKGDALKKLDDEHAGAFADRVHSGPLLVQANHHDNHGKVVRLNRQGMKEIYRGIYEIFSCDYMDQVSRRYFQPHRFDLNREIFLTHEIPHEKSIFPWHYDRIHYLKFYIYVTDTTRANGAFEYVPGSHREGFYRFNYHALLGESVQGLPYIIPDEDILNDVVLDGKAGDLIVFDAGGIHKGGVVSPGHTRRVARGHTNAVPFYGYNRHPLFSRGWWLQSPFNFAKYFKDDVCRVMSEEMKPHGIRGEYKDH